MEQINISREPVEKKTNSFFRNFLIFFAVIAFSFIAGYLYNEKYKDYEVEDVEETIDEEDTDNAQVKWSQKRQIEGLGLINTEYITRLEDYVYYHIGYINDEKYRGWDLVMITIPCWNSLSCSTLPYIIGVQQKDNFVILGNHSVTLEWLYDDDENYFTREIETDYDYVLDDLIYPDKITDLTENVTLHKVGKVFRSDWLNEDDFKEMFFHEKYGQAYTDQHYGIYFRALDDTIIIYNLEIDLDTPVIKWDDGTTTIDSMYEYSDYYTIYYVDYYMDVVENIDIEKELKEVGVNEKGDKIYFPKNPEHEILKSAYLEMGGFSPSTGREVSYSEFLEGRPLFFWKDPFGRLIKFTNSEFITHAEMGKPVIYLYPKKEQEVWVEVNPVGGITVSEPEYGNGWHVMARPNGNLKEVKTGKFYPYLFWESGGYLYEQPKEGFVIKEKDVRNFLIDKLSLYAFNKTEIDDFLEFWLPLMQDYPYYFITFLETEEMNKLAPLRVNPQPDTIIRILMDFSPLEKPMKVEELEIKPQKREGFTLMEWGGIIRP